MKLPQSNQTTFTFKSVLFIVMMFTINIGFSNLEPNSPSNNLFVAYELSDCKDEATLLKAYTSTLNHSRAMKSSLAVMAEVSECQTVSNCAYDASQFNNGGEYCGTLPLSIGATGDGNMHVGVIGDGWMIPEGATILSAEMQFTAESNSIGSAALDIYGIAEDNAGIFSTTDDVIGRTKTTASVPWSPGTWTAGDAGTAQKTPDLTALVQEIVNRPGYTEGNTIGFVIRGTGRRTAESFDSDAALAPVICITYDVPEPPTSTCDGCPNISVVSLDGVPNFPTIDLLNLCSAPDTASILIYNTGACMLQDVNVTITFDEGLSYGGFVFMDPNSTGSGTVSESDLSDLTAPVFTISQIDSSMVFIIDIAVQADCAVDTESEEDINFDAEVSFTYDDTNGTSPICTEVITDVGAYNSGIRVPVLNVLTVSPSELNISESNTPQCQRILISQDGIQAFLDGFQFEINGVDQDVYLITSIDISDVVVPPSDYSYDPVSQTVSLTVTDNYFINDTGANNVDGDLFFETGENIFIDVCYQVMGCTTEANSLTYNAFYGCNNEVCGDVSQIEGAVNFTPNFGANAVALSSNVQYGGIWGDNLIYDITVSSANTTPLDGLWEDLSFKYKGCIISNTSIVNLTINGATVPAEIWTAEAGTVTIDLTINTVDFDGPGGIMDIDGDGFFDDLPGGNTVTIGTELEIGCAMEGDCASIACSLTQLEINGRHNCGQDMQEFPTIGGDGPINFFYGEISSSNNTMTISGYGIPITEVFVTTPDVWVQGTVPFTYDYEFGSNNIDACANPGDMQMVVTVIAGGNRINNIRYSDGTAMYLGSPVTVSDADWVLGTTEDGTIDTIAYEFVIEGGDPGATMHDYEFYLDYRGDCFPNDYAYLTYRVQETCIGCGDTDPCEIVRSCGSAAVYVDWRGLNCVCRIEANVDTLYRTNYGYADKELTQKLTAADIPPADLQRFVPGDTMFFSSEFEINDVTALTDADHYWNFHFVNYIYPDVIWDMNNASFKGWYWYDASTGNKVEIGIPDCFKNYPNATRDNYYYPSISLRNMGVEHYSVGYNSTVPGTGAANNYGTCETDPNINPTYDPDIVGYDVLNMSSTDYAADLMQFIVWWGRPASCPDTGSDTQTGTSSDHVNPCFDQFFLDYPIADGDKIFIDIEVPMMHNPARDLIELNPGGSFSDATYIEARLSTYTVDEATCTNSRVEAACDYTRPYQAHLPGPVTIATDVVVEDCVTEVNYEFTLTNPVPTDLATGELPWFVDEYRPFMATEFLEFQFPTNMVYLNDGVIIMPDGTEVTFPAQYIDDSEGNISCIPDGTGGTCCVAADTLELAAMRLVSDMYNTGKSLSYGYGPDGPNETGNYCDVPQLVRPASDIYPQLMIGGAESCTYGIRYNLSSLCPEDVESTDFRLEYQFAEPYIPTLAYQRSNSYYGNVANAAGDPYLTTSYYWLFPINPFGESCSSEPDEGCNYYFQKITTDPVASNYEVNPMRQGGLLTTTPDDFEDNSQNFPKLIPMLANLLKADLADENETNVYTVCAGDATATGATHTNVVTSIEVPNSVEFIDAQDAMGNSLTWVLAQTLADSKVYGVTMDDLAPGECQEITIVTELLFCPVGLDVETEVCVSTVSGCLDPAKAAALSAAGGACDEVSACYQYVAEEADIQVEWLLPDPMGSDEYGLCEEIPMSVRIKNVKPSVLTEITQDFYFPAGLTPVSGSWEVCYPGGPGFTAPCVSIPVSDEPVAVAGENNIFGLNYSWDEDGDWSDYVNQNGLPGILNAADQPIELDSNQVSFNFLVETTCDEFVSGTSVYYQAFGADPCESTVSSMFVDSEPIIIVNANPANFAQFFVFADPAQANCGEDATLVLTYLNVSPIGESKESTVCLDLETETFDYMTGSVQWVSPGSHSPTITEEMNGPVTHVCFNIPDGIGPGEAFQISLDYSIPEDIACGEQDLGVAVTSEIMDQSCMALGEECSVYVLNTINPQIQIDFLPPLNVDAQTLMTKCPNADGTVDLCYDLVLSNPGSFYSGDVTVKLIRDVNLNGIIDDPIIDTELADMNHFVIVNTGETFEISGCLTVSEAEACPVFLMITQATDCVCDNIDYYYDSIEPAINDDMETEYTLCPGVPFGIANCGSWTYTVTPSNGASVETTAANDSLYITLNAGFGVSAPVVLTVSSQTGGCQSFDFPIELYSLSDFEFGPYAGVEACNVGCRQLNLNIPSQYESSVTVEWFPNQYLDDNTSLTPTICNPEDDINYFVQLTFTSQDGSTCLYTANFPVTVLEQQTEEVIEDGNLCSVDQSTFAAPTGYSTYNWIRINADGSETTVASGSASTYTATVEATYYVTYQNLGAVCAIRSNIFSVSACLEMEKSITSIVPTSNANEYTVSYTILVSNPGDLVSEYDIYDEPGFDTDIVASAASYSSDAPGVTNVGLVLPAPATPGWLLGEDVSIAGGATHTYTIVYVVTIDLEDGATGDDMYTSCGQGSGPPNAGPGEALYNNASLDLDNDPTTPEVEDNDCGELPYLTMDKTLISTTSTGNNCYDIVYTIEVENLGGAVGTYDLVDDPGYDDDFTLTSAIFETTAVGNPGGSLPTTTTLYTLADDQMIQPSVKDSFTLFISVCLDLEEGSTGDNVYNASCGTTNDPSNPEPGEGLYNLATLDVNNDNNPDIEDEVCDDVPYFTLTKDQSTATLEADDTYTIVYTITVNNIGGAAGSYNLNDLPSFDDDIDILSASYTSDAGPSNPVLATMVPAAGWELAVDQAIPAFSTDIYTLTVNVDYDFFDGIAADGDDMYTACGEGGGTPGGPGEGLYNEALLDTNDDGTPDLTDDECQDLESVDVALMKIVNTPGPYSYGDVINFDITVFNQGTVTLTDIEVTDYPSCGYSYVGGSTTTWLPNGANYETTVEGPLAPGESMTISINYEVIPCTSDSENAYLNVAEVSYMEDDAGTDVSNDDIDSVSDDIEGNDPGGSVDTPSDDVVDGDGSGTIGDEVPGTDEDDQDPAQIEIFDLALTKVLDTAGPYSYGDELTFTI